MPRPIDLMIVGAQKAATSSLKHYLGQHPEVCCHPQGEMTYFVFDEEYAGGYDKAYPFYFGAAGDAARAIVAKNVGVMVVNAAIARLKQHNPAAHVVAVLRNPVDRAYSAYWYCRRRGWEDRETFEEGLAAEVDRAREGGVTARHTAYIGRGLYAGQIEELLKTFGAGQVHVYLSEDLARDPLAVCRPLFAAIGVDPGFEPDTTRRHNQSAIAKSDTMARFLAGTNPVRRALKHLVPRQFAFRLKRRLRQLNEEDFEPPPMTAETRARLLDRFAPENRRLADLIRRDLSGWSR
jgi:hypothetical protein